MVGHTKPGKPWDGLLLIEQHGFVQSRRDDAGDCTKRHMHCYSLSLNERGKGVVDALNLVHRVQQEP